MGSRTSAALLKILLRRRGLRDIRYDEQAPSLREMLLEHDAALLIGDAALAADVTGLHVLDLAAEWFAQTRLPFVFALWAARPGVATKHATGPLRLPAAGTGCHRFLVSE